MNVINFVAVDVETATSNRSSICQLSLAFVADGQITEKKSWLIQPPENKYDAFNTYLSFASSFITFSSLDIAF